MTEGLFISCSAVLSKIQSKSGSQAGLACVRTLKPIRKADSSVGQALGVPRAPGRGNHRQPPSCGWRGCAAGGGDRSPHARGATCPGAASPPSAQLPPGCSERKRAPRPRALGSRGCAPARGLPSASDPPPLGSLPIPGALPCNLSFLLTVPMKATVFLFRKREVVLFN